MPADRPTWATTKRTRGIWRRRSGTILAGAAVLTYVVLGRYQQLRWGATGEEFDEPLPGDDCIPSPDFTSTRAITIGAPVDQVWPWIAQLGQGRGGFYSYDVLENLVGCHIHSADHIVPEFQVVGVGDTMNLHPDVALEVVAFEPRRSFVIRGAVPMGKIPPPYDFTWAFVLRDQPDKTTRLLVRERYGYTRWWAPALVESVGMISFVMSQKMLRGIKDRVERTTALP